MSKKINTVVLVFIFVASVISTLARFPLTDITTLANVATNVGGTIYESARFAVLLI